MQKNMMSAQCHCVEAAAENTSHVTKRHLCSVLQARGSETEAHASCRGEKGACSAQVHASTRACPTKLMSHGGPCDKEAVCPLWSPVTNSEAAGPHRVTFHVVLRMQPLARG